MMTPTSPAVPGLTWQEAKAQAQAMELEIAALIPQEAVVSTFQWPTGSLLQCGGDFDPYWTWNGATTVTVYEGTDIEAITKDIQRHYNDSRFQLRTRYDRSDAYELQLSSPETAENYIVGEGLKPTEIRIDSGSPCFELAEDQYAGGEF